MSRPRSVTKAEERAYAGENEAQDSQALFDEFRATYGVGLLSSSPPPEEQFARQQRWSQVTSRSSDCICPRQKSLTLNTANRPLTPGSGPVPNQEDRGQGPPNEKLNASFGPRRARGQQQQHAQLSSDSRVRDEAAPPDPGNHRQRARTPARPQRGRRLPAASISPPPRRGAAVPDTRPSQKPDDADPSHQPPPPRPSELLLKRRMDFSDSPTQSNNDRSYEEYRVTQGRPTASSQSTDDASPGGHPDTQQTHVTDDRRTLHEDDTGAVNFDLVGFANSQEDDSGLVNFDLDPFPHETQSKAGFSDAVTDSDPEADQEDHDGDGQDEAELPPIRPWERPRVPLSHCRTSSNSMPPPQTPLLGGRVFGKSSLLEGSQMFTQTSGIKKALSPTSSRPSPRIFPNNTISPNPHTLSSPFGDRARLRTSPVQGATSSPEFALTDRDPVSFEHETDTVPASPPFKPRNTRRLPEPISNYVRSSPSLRPEQNRSEVVDSDSDSDAEYRQRMNSLRARRKQEEAARSLSFISLSRPSSREEERVVVPSTNREKKRTRPSTPAQRYLDQCHGKYVSDKDDTQPMTVADSQGVTAKGGETDASGRSSNEVEQVLRDSQGPSALPQPNAHECEHSRNPRLPAIDAIAASSGRDMIPETSPVPTANGPRKVGQVPSNQSTQVDSSSIPLQSSAARNSDAQVVHPSGEDMPGTELEVPVTDEAGNLAGTDATGADDQGVANQNNESLPSTQPLDTDPPETQLPGGEPEEAGRPPEPGQPAEATRSPASEEVSKLPDAEEAPENAKPSEEPEPVHSTPPAPSMVAPSSQPIRRSGRARNVTTPSAKPSSAPVPPPSSSSSLSELTLTPVLSSSFTPDTGECERDELENPAAPSPAVARAQRQVRPRNSLVTYSPARRKQEGMRRNSVRSVRLSSVSTDELAASPASVSDTRTRSARSFKLVKDIPQAHPGLFQGMIFAISFQSSDEKEKKQAETWIRQEGGKVLSIGFNELFEPSSFALPAESSASFQSTPLQLMHEARDAGFTALIADNHSRKVKYMQALALGLPCLSWKWVSACVAKNTLVDWSSYVLCAGSSMVLGNAIRSRSLAVYDAASARLQDVVDQRPKLLHSTEILLFMKKTKSEEKRMPYVFLAQILGAALVRAHTLDEARAQLREREEMGRPFDWVYIDEHEAGVEQALFGKPGQSSTKKRKRNSASVSGRAPKRIRTLTDELVVQSLILGRLVEEGEMDE